MATTLCEGEHQLLTAFAGLTTRREAQEILRRSRRIASALNGHSDNDEAVRAIYQLLAQEGDLVGEFLEAVVARSFKGYASSPETSREAP